ncbi:secreted RxLR effector protein 161-like [Quercus robur]|uniref:secreted RxLR effector protein 161-like n=1 Tax=Quercus robur TaxID=38942 RepID=UPI002161EE35|nr:secreted RxLR effector protein 161-like [Quercus robur]
MSQHFSKLMQAEFEMSMIGELTHFLGLQIRQQDSGKSVDSSLYRSMICSLLYLSASRPDISYSVGVYARYQANPKESHMTALKRIIKYVKTTADFGVWYNKDTNDVLAGYSDAD